MSEVDLSHVLVHIIDVAAADAKDFKKRLGRKAKNWGHGGRTVPN